MDLLYIPWREKGFYLQTKDVTNWLLVHHMNFICRRSGSTSQFQACNDSGNLCDFTICKSHIINLCRVYVCLAILTSRITLLASNSAFPCRITFNASNRCTLCFQYAFSPQLQSIPLLRTLTFCSLHLPHLHRQTDVSTYGFDHHHIWNSIISYLRPYCNIGSPFASILFEPMTFPAITIKLPSSCKLETK